MIPLRCRFSRVLIRPLMILTAFGIAEFGPHLPVCAEDDARSQHDKNGPTLDQAGPRREISVLDGCAWIGVDGIRAAWLSYKQIDDAMLASLHRSRVNTVFLKHGFHDLLDLESARWEGDVLVIDPRDVVRDRMLESTRRAAAAGVHVFWIANYELEQMLPHLERLGYQPAYAEGPARYLRPGPHRDAAPLDPVFWRGITGAHGELVATLSRKHPIDGVLYDVEHYAGGLMYLQNGGYSDVTFQKYLASRTLDVTAEQVPAGTRYEFLKTSGRLPDYERFLEEQAYEQGRDLANRWHEVNPHLMTGIWPLLDNWFSQGLLRGLGGAAPTLGLSGVEYYHGSDQSASMAEFFESRNGNLLYMPGFYPPFAYSPDELQSHVEQAIRTTGRYWMLSPQEQLRRPEYQAALSKAAESTAFAQGERVPVVDLIYRVEQNEGGPNLIVETGGDALPEAPLLSLRATFGGAPLCREQPMHKTDDGNYRTAVPLLRRITNNRHLPAAYRSGACYRFSPLPHAFRYEDPHHTKLTDGRAYGFFGTSVAWEKSVDEANVLFDLHREYRIVRVEIAQPSKMEDRIGGPTKSVLRLARRRDLFGEPQPFAATFAVSGKDYSEPDNPVNDTNDPRHNRAWLSWKVDLPESPARWLRIDLQRTRPNSSISLGEVVVTALFDGEIQAGIQLDGRRLPILEGTRWTVPSNPPVREPTSR